MAPAVVRSAADLRSGDWFRLHPLTPVLQGGVVLVGLLGAGLAALWETVILQVILRVWGEEVDEEDADVAFFVADSLGLIALAALAVVVVSALVFWLQWRVHVIRMDDSVLEVAKGIIAKSSRRARRDRINTIGVRRPLIPRLLGVAKLDIQAAGSDANIVLAYLPFRVAQEVRREILHTPEPDSGGAESQTVVREVEVSLFRYVASLMVSVETVFFGAGLLFTIAGAAVSGEGVAWLGPIAVMFGYVAYVADRFFRVGNFVVDSLEGDIRVAFGLLSTSLETIPPARIHALQISQPWPWKLFGWWRVDANLASTPGAQNQKMPSHTLLLPVATLEEMKRIVALTMPSLSEGRVRDAMMAMLTTPHEQWLLDETVRSPERAKYRIPLSFSVNGLALMPPLIMMRTGRWIAKLTVIPLQRVQSTSVSAGPWHRALGLASFAVQSVDGPVSTRVPGLDYDEAEMWWTNVNTATVDAINVKPRGRATRKKVL